MELRLDYNEVPMTLIAGTKLHRYEIQSQLSTGGIGAYRSRDTRCGQAIVTAEHARSRGGPSTALRTGGERYLAEPSQYLGHSRNARSATFLVGTSLEDETLRT
jgi:hypothetical protein